MSAVITPTISQHHECVTPAVARRDGRTERHAERLPDRRAKVIQPERGSPRARREVVGNDRVRRRHTAGLTDADSHASQNELRISRRETAGHRRRAPQCASEGQHAHAVGPVCEPRDGDRDQTVKQREIQAADAPQLAVGDVELILNRLGEDRQQLPGRGNSGRRRTHSMPSTNQARTSGRAGCAVDNRLPPRSRTGTGGRSYAAASSRSGWRGRPLDGCR